MPLRAEPAVVGAAIAALLNAIVLIVFKQELDAEVRAAIVTVVTVLAGLYIRSKVTPTG